MESQNECGIQFLSRFNPESFRGCPDGERLLLVTLHFFIFSAFPYFSISIPMATYVSLLHFTDQGIRNVKDTVNRAAAATAEAEKMGAKVTQALWTMGAYDLVLLLDAPDDETVSAFSVKLGSVGNVKSQTMRAFRREEMESILTKMT
jgi:uncharacterized protein with GYD domain